MPGSGFTGSTLLGFLLNAHPDCASIGAATGLIDSVDLRTYPCSCGALFTECGFWKRVAERTRALGHPVDPYRTGFWATHFAPTRNRWLDALGMRSLRNDVANAVRDALFLRAGPVRRRLEEIGAINHAFARAVLEILGKSVFVDSARDHQRPKLLSRLPGFDVRVIHLIKDARANSASVLKHFPGRSVAEAARGWRRANLEADRVRRLLPADRWMRLRYDDLCADPQGTLDRIADFLSVRRAPLPPDFRAVPHHIIGNEMRLLSVGQVRLDTSWRERLSEADLAVIARIAGAENRRFGFDWPGSGNVL
jgi:hypothetical protein